MLSADAIAYYYDDFSQDPAATCDDAGGTPL
jgi:hypothetical protein